MRYFAALLLVSLGRQLSLRSEDVIVLPAVGGTVRAPFAVAADPDSRHARCITVPKGTGHGKEGIDGPMIDNGWVDLAFSCEHDRTYQVWTRVRFSNQDSNSFFVQIDGGSSITPGDNEMDEWHWVRIEAPVKLVAGPHTIRLRNREDGVAVDEVRLIPAGLDAQSYLPKEWRDKIVIMDPADANRRMEAYFRTMSPIRPPKETGALLGWTARRDQVRKLVLQDIGLSPLPKNIPLDARIIASEHRDGFTLSRLYFQLFPGCYGSAWLYVPDGVKGKAPAVLCPHGHFEGGAYHPEVQALMIGLVKKGFVALIPDSIHAADFETGMCPIGLMTWQNLRALDYLSARKDVDKKRIGITGASGGGQQAMYVMAVDDRPAVAVPVVMTCYFERILSDQGSHCWCNHAPGVSTDTDMTEMACMFAPKPALFLSSTQDWTSLFPTVEWLEVQKVWKLYGRSSNAESRIDDIPHDFGRVRREATYRFLTKHLGIKDDGTEPPMTTETTEFLRAMDKPIPGVRDWAAAARWYRTYRVKIVSKAGFRNSLYKVLRSVDPNTEPAADSMGNLQYHGGTVERLLIHGEGSLALPGFYFFGGDKSAVVLLPNGKRDAFTPGHDLSPIVKSLLAKGYSVLAIDPRLVGELARDWTWNCTIWGRPGAGMQADDARWAAAYLRSVRNAKEVVVVGIGRMRVPALFAGMLGGFDKVMVDGPLGSYRATPLHDQNGYCAGSGFDSLPLVPNILTVGDLPSIEKALDIPVERLTFEVLLSPSAKK